MKLAAVVVCHCGAEEQANTDLKPLLEFGEPAMVEVGPMPYPVLNTILDAAYPKGALNYWKSSFLRSADDDLIDVLISSFEAAPSPMTSVLFEHFHGAVSRIGETETAWPHRTPGFNLVITAEWLDPSTTDENVAWVRALYSELQPYVSGRRYVNYLDADEGEDALQAAYGPNYERLTKIKATYDPENVFRHNQNIPPAS
jgi:hypothetical protein